MKKSDTGDRQILSELKEKSETLFEEFEELRGFL